MKEAEFKAWLVAQGYPASSIAAWRSDTRKVDNAHGLDRQFDLAGGASMLAELAYSRADEAAGAPNPSRLDYAGPLYSNLADCRAPARAYFRFRNSEARPHGRFGELDREAVLEAVAACDDGQRYASKAIVRDALARRGSDWLPGGGECTIALERLGFVVIDWPELNRARNAFLRQMPDFTDFCAAAGSYWDVERAYKNGLSEQAKAISARQDDDRAADQSLYWLLSVGGSGLPLSWRTLSEVQNADPELRDRFYTALGLLARSDRPLEEAVPLRRVRSKPCEKPALQGAPGRTALHSDHRLGHAAPRSGKLVQDRQDRRDGAPAVWPQAFPANRVPRSRSRRMAAIDARAVRAARQGIRVAPAGYVRCSGVHLGCRKSDAPRELDPVPVWMVTSLWGQEDGLPRFVERREWSLLTDTGSASNRRVREMQVGDRIFLKDFVPRARSAFRCWYRDRHGASLPSRGHHH